MEILEAAKIKPLTYRMTKITILTNFSSVSMQHGPKKDICSDERKKVNLPFYIQQKYPSKMEVK